MVRPIILTAGFIERKVRNMGWGGGELLAFFLVIPAIPFAFTLTNLAFPLLSLSDLSHYEQDAFRWLTWDAFGLHLSSFTLEAHCKSLMDLGACDCIQFPLYVIVGEKSAVASHCKLMASKLTGLPVAASRLYFGGKGGVFFLPLKLLNKCWPSKIVYINRNAPPPPFPQI